ncbi:MAG TPA: DUF255 domain-containing protein [Bacteroidales bacterium]|nr:DUF255 domain-containing protein [Bacteroidales bacterium]
MNETSLKYCNNNLGSSSSPYLIQHKDNPIYWQEWSNDVISYARSAGKPLFVSVGYSTCHWCHVMASEAFSDERTAKYLNDNFVNIKVDREQRPDIDQYLMEFIQQQRGQGGWPLNVFLTPDLHPIFALTYAPANQKGSMNSFISIVQQVYAYFQKNSSEIVSFSPDIQLALSADNDYIISTLEGLFDSENGGFGKGHKFPSHSTLLYLLYSLSVENNRSVKDICYRTLEEMRLRGLTDHLQGGIFRYCVDPQWTIPHFEKMLYDQAMALWTYSVASRVFERDEFKDMAENIIRCLDDSFEEKGFFISAHDADTDHEEGLTYLWSQKELREHLSQDEIEALSEVYEISLAGNFDGKNHLVRKNDKPLKIIESKLLSVRRAGKQPERDDKILCGTNALTAIALIQAARMLDRKDLNIKASKLVNNLIDLFWDGNILAHSCYKGKVQKQGFLMDASSLFTVLTFLYEDDKVWKPFMDTFEKYLLTFRDDKKWIESRSDDFITVEASWFDHPVPSGASMAEYGLARAALLTGKELFSKDYGQPYQADFYNIAVMISRGSFHVITSLDAQSWTDLPVNSIQLRGDIEQECYMGICSPAKNGKFPFDAGTK